MDLPVDFQNVSSSGFQSAIQVEVRFLISLFLFGWRWRCWEGNSAAGGERREKNAAARRSKATFQGGGVAGWVYAKTATPPAVAAPGVALYKLRAKPEMAEENVRKSIG